MDVSYLLDGLNDKQRDAVAAPPQHMLVLAGAGSGKTRVLVHRLAWLMQVERVAPYSLLAVTFTNKASQEMRGRIESTIGVSLNNLWMGTFHGLSHRMLRAHYQEANLPQSFQIIDSDDQHRLVKRVLKALNLDEKHWPAKQIQWFINARKDEGQRPGMIDAGADFSLQQMVKIYAAYQDMCDRAGLVDFAEILLRSFELLKTHDAVRNHYQQRFRHILVDEFQDTNAIQYNWLRLLAGSSAKVMIVGDDDQSIYGWRGAKVENIQQFLKDFAGADTIRLEQNYRSTATILKAANAVISNNSGRLGKDLWTDGSEGETISSYNAFNELDEARFIVSRIRDWHNKGNPLTESAILYRNNAQSRVLEEALIQEGLHYRIYGGLRFYERQEIKDALAYLRLLNNRQDDAAMERVINTPARGIGETTMNKVRQQARASQQTLWQALEQMLAEKQLSGRAANAIEQFMQLITQLDTDLNELPLHEQAEQVIKQSGLYAMYQAEKGEKAQTRIENLNELVTACQNFDSVLQEEMTPLAAFLSQAALEAGEYQAEEHSDAVQLMTLHSAKGLEFPLVFMCGLEEGMFPSQQSGDDPTRLEEERRLCYVGMTRAMQKLYLCHAQSRRLYGQEQYPKPSRFLREIPDDCVEEIRLTTQVSRPAQLNRYSHAASHSAFENTGFKLGQRVLHEKFGEGTVLNYEGSGPQSRIQVNFDQLGSKWLMTAYARLEAV
ncbi:DNA helicase II [Alishewanella sp. 16-MA]|uniref:DNA 3'-5' helicase n=1 Tax=Alishewanella maricola TaxID=2795740 RepID=A0ABS8C4V9_9ALTE|nr:DNA helicase II [Alishewanella maricola]MCB5227378.1 DNA helicase II [Alishewanella maricola]MDP4945308.1 DNA helicase II [Alishewanella sp.]MDP5035136.1 DNA helicase II [Alishewanella sp.]MDP5186410.1 DNA helicase II [Alishewanella sp.]